MSIRLDWIGFCLDEPSQARVLKRSSIMSLSAESSTAMRLSSWLGKRVEGCESSQAGSVERVRMGRGLRATMGSGWLKRCTGTAMGSGWGVICGAAACTGARRSITGCSAAATAGVPCRASRRLRSMRSRT
ncbi:hypothetical protein FQZ97_1070090 [compost metagenome]